jgi:hypothetical protein
MSIYQRGGGVARECRSESLSKRSAPGTSIKHLGVYVPRLTWTLIDRIQVIRMATKKEIYFFSLIQHTVIILISEE